MTSPFRIRPVKLADRAFVVDSWRRSYEGSPSVRGAERNHYVQEMTRTILRLLDKATCLVACDPNDEDTIVGFAAFTGSELHYVYVKRDFRGMGIARDLLKDVRIGTFTFMTPTARPRAGWAFTPRFTI